MHRVLLVIVLTAGSAHADKPAYCQLHVANAKVTTVGCYQDVESTGDHTYGARVCIVLAGGQCSGLLWQWEGNLEGNVSVLVTARCSAKRQGPVSFSALQTVTTSKGTEKWPVTFSGKYGKRVVSGTFMQAGQRSKMTMRQMSNADAPKDVVQDLRTRTTFECAK